MSSNIYAFLPKLKLPISIFFTIDTATRDLNKYHLDLFPLYLRKFMPHLRQLKYVKDTNALLRPHSLCIPGQRNFF